VGVGAELTSPHHERNQHVNKVLTEGLGLLTDKWREFFDLLRMCEPLKEDLAVWS